MKVDMGGGSNRRYREFDSEVYLNQDLASELYRDMGISF